MRDPEIGWATMIDIYRRMMATATPPATSTPTPMSAGTTQRGLAVVVTGAGRLVGVIVDPGCAEVFGTNGAVGAGSGRGSGRGAGGALGG